MRPFKVGHILKSSGAWSTSGPLLCGCSKRCLPLQYSLEHCGPMTEPPYLRMRCLHLDEKWLEIQSFTIYKATHFVACHAVNFLHNPDFSAACTWKITLSVITQDSWPSVMIGAKTETDSTAVFESSCFVTTEWSASGRTTFLSICASISLFRLPSHREYHPKSPRYLNRPVTRRAQGGEAP